MENFAFLIVKSQWWLLRKIVFSLRGSRTCQGASGSVGCGRPRFRVAAFVLLSSAVLCLASEPAALLADEARSILEQVSPAALRGHVSFLASDALEGRGTPSAGLEIAAEYVASRFRAAGLEPAAGDSYFQTAEVTERRKNLDGFALKLAVGDRAVDVAPSAVTDVQASCALDLTHTPVGTVQLKETAELDGLVSQGAAGKVVLASAAGMGGRGLRRALSRLRRLATDRQPALVVVLDEEEALPSRMRGPTLHLPFERRASCDSSREESVAGARVESPIRAGPPQVPSPERVADRAPLIQVRDRQLLELFRSLRDGAQATADVHLPPPLDRPIMLRNVAAIVRGTGVPPEDSYILVSAHYDHVGIGEVSSGDAIYNGANDNASGTATLLEVAAALQRAEGRLKRSVVFVAFFGEENGLLGSRYYAERPLLPLEKTVLNLNLEQTGRPDGDGGGRAARASLTGFAYSTATRAFVSAGEQTGVRVEPTAHSDDYFSRSDNVAFARKGVPAHTLCVTYEYTDYHRPSDHWDKIDYENMALVTRTVALGLLIASNGDEEPRWDESNPKTADYVKAWKERRAASPAGPALAAPGAR